MSIATLAIYRALGSHICVEYDSLDVIPVTSLDVIVMLAIWFRLIVNSDTVTDNQLLMLSNY